MAKVKIQGNASGTGVLTIAAPNTNTDRTITLPDGTGTLIADNGSGNVGIGTSSPTLASGWNKVLHVHSTGGTGSLIRLTDTVSTSGASADSGLMIGQYSNESYIINRDSGNMRFHTGGTERLRIDDNGQIYTPEVYNTTTAGAANTHIHSNGYLHRSTSSIKYKQDVETLEDSYADSILNLRPVWFKSKCANDNPDWGHWGLIAEEVAEIDPRLVFWRTDEYVDQTNEETGETEQVTIPLETPEAEGVQYDRMIPHLINLLQRQDARIAELTTRIEQLENA
jgi:hypothetical protein